MRTASPWKDIAVVAAIVVVVVACGRALTGSDEPVVVGKRLPELSGHDIVSGNRLSAADYEGHPTLVHFFATWCGPCMAEFPAVQSIQRRYEEEGLRVISVSLDTDRVRLQRFIDSKGVDWPVLYSASGWRDPIAGELGVKSIPRIILLDARGRVAADGLRGSRIAAETNKLLDS